MAAKEDPTNKRTRKSIFSFKRTYNSPSSDPPKGKAPTGPTSAEDVRGILNRKDGIHNFGVALELLKSVGEGNELLAPLKAVCGGLKILVDTAEAIKQNDEDLRDLNTRLHRQLDALEQQDKTLSASELNLVHKDIDYFVKSLRTYILDLNRVQKVLDTLHHKEGGSAKKFFKKALMVYSVREEIKDCSRQLDESFQLFMNSVTSFIAHQAVLLRNDMASMQIRADEKKANDALAQLPCSDARGNQHDSCLEGTRQRILKDLTQWATNILDRPVYCLVDQAGTGKSTISIHMAQKWENEGAGVARFFFSLPNSVTTAADVATTLARDMANMGPSPRSLVLDAINDHPNITGHSIKEKLEWFVFRPLEQRRGSYYKVLAQLQGGIQEKSYTKAPANIHPEISQRGDTMVLDAAYRDALRQTRNQVDEVHMRVLEQAYTAYTEELEKAYVNALDHPPVIVIDALDECSLVDRGILLQSFLGYLEEASRVGSYPLKLFITCRPEEDILIHIHDPRFSHFVRQADFGMVLEKSSSSDDDIALYAKTYLGHVLSHPDMSRFVARANGLFIWASTARAFLEDALDPSACLEDLLLPNIKSSPLNSLYDKILVSAMDRVGRHQLEPLKKVLEGICVAREPISVHAMDELLGLSNGVTLRVVKKLRSVLSDATDGKVVQVLHPTFIEYFKACSQPDNILFSTRQAETILACGCLDILLSGQLRYDICGLMGPDRFAPNNQDIENLKWRLEENTTPGLRYAAVHGLSHVASSLGDEVVILQLREFFEKYSLYWIELMSFLGKIYHLMQSVHHLKLQIEDSMTNCIGLLIMADENWCDELLRLIQPFQVLVEKSALQVYFSALPFTPSTSQICHFYGQDFGGRIPKVLRGAWRVQSQYTILSGHTNMVGCLSFSPDSQKLASGSDDNTIRLWDATTGAAIGDPLTGHTSRVICLSFSPDGRQLASGSEDNTIRIWNATTVGADGEPLAGHTGQVTCLSFSPDSRSLASGSYDGSVRLWDVTTGAAVGKPLTGHTSRVICLSFSLDGRQLASGSKDYTIRLWNAKNGAAIGEPLTGHTGAVECLSLSPDGRSLASGSFNGSVRRWNATTGAAVGELLTGHTGRVTCLSFSPDGRQLASGSGDCTIRLWDATTGATIGEPLTGHTSWVTCLSFSPDGRQLASGSWDRAVRLWDATQSAYVGEQQAGHASGVNCLSFSPDGQQLASGSGDCTIRLWDATTGAAIGEPLTGHTSFVTCLSFSPDGRLLAAGSHDHTIRLWDATTGATIGDPLTGHTDYVTCLTFSSDGRVLVSGSRDKTIRLWDVTSGAGVGEPFSGHTNGVARVFFSPDGQFLASSSSDRTVRLWDVPSGATVGQPVQYDKYIRSIALHMHDESLFLTVDDGVVEGRSAVWRLSEDALVKLPPGEQPPVSPFFPSRAKFNDPWTYILSSTGFYFSLPSSFRCDIFSSQGRKLAYGGRDGSVIIIDCSHLV